MDKENQKLFQNIIGYSIELSIQDIYEKINEINLKLNRITSKFDYLIELLKEIGENDSEDQEF